MSKREDDRFTSDGIFAACITCVHFLGNRKCEAFKEIPDPIWKAEIQHIAPFKDDNGIRYKEIKR